MRARYTLRVKSPKLALLLVLALPAFADTIHLKNGMKIQADSTRRVGNRLEYTTGDSTFSIPIASVDQIEAPASVLKGGPPKCPKSRAETVAGHPTAPHTTQRVPLSAELLCKQFGPRSTQVKDWMPSCEQIMAHGGIELDALAATEMKCDAPLSADAYYLAANFDHAGEEEQGALEYLQTSLGYAPEHPNSLVLIIDVLENLHRYSDEVEYAEEAALILGPQNLPRLARAYYLAGNAAEAMRIWKAYASVMPGANVQSMRAQAEQQRQQDEFNNRRQWPDPEPNQDQE